MRSNRGVVLKWVGLSEGGYVNHKKDPGGETNRGITRRTYDAWRTAKGLPVQSVKLITRDEAEQIIFENYMQPVRFDELPDGLDYAMADYSVNSGPARAVKELQRLLGIRADGIFGNQTFAALQKVEDVSALVEKLCLARMKFLRSLKTWSTFGKGWTARVMGQQNGAQDDDSGVIDRAVKMARGVRPARLADPVAHRTAKAPEPERAASVAQDGEALGALAGGGGVVTAAGGLFSALGGLHPVAQGIAIAGLVLALVGAAYVLRNRIRKIAAGV